MMMMMMMTISRRMALLQHSVNGKNKRRLVGTCSSNLSSFLLPRQVVVVDTLISQRFGCGSIRQQQAFSSSTTTTTPATTPATTPTGTSTQQQPHQQQQQARIVRTLYKQLLRWCQRTDPQFPLGFFVPPIQVKAPQQCEAHRLHLLAQLHGEVVNQNNNSIPKNVKYTMPLITKDVVLLQRILRDLPPQCWFVQHSSSSSLFATTLIAPVYDAIDLANLFRCLFRLNTMSLPCSSSTMMEFQKIRVNLAFEALKSLNELKASRPFQELLRQHQKEEQEKVRFAGGHQIMTKLFRVGQVVQHIHERWRGVVVGWQLSEHDDHNAAAGAAAAAASAAGDDKVTSANQQQQQPQQHTSSSSTSLTTKKYPTATTTSSSSSSKHSDSLPKYEVVWDIADVVLAKGRTGPEAMMIEKEIKPLTIANESELELVKEACLTRIHGSHVSEYFDAYDATTHSFVPNALLAYQYPVDAAAAAAAAQERAEQRNTSDNDDDDDNNKTLLLIPSNEKQQQLCHNVIQGIKELCQHLENVIEEELQMWVSDASIGGGEEPVLLTQILRRLNLLVTGRHLEKQQVQQQKQQATHRKSLHTVSSSTDLATSYLHEFYLLSTEIFDILRQRQKRLEYADKAEFRIGDVVRHKRYNYRGVVVAWDPKPTEDVTLWDGLQGIAHPTELPFYQVIPDPYDCIRAFGSERGLRYVCQENLQYCPADETDLAVDLDDPEWKRELIMDGGGGGYRYIPPSQLLFKYAQDEKHNDPDGVLSRCMDQIEKEINEWQWHIATNTLPDNAPASQLNLENLIALGQICDTSEDAKSVQEMIREIRLANQRIHLRRKVIDGMATLSAGKALEALEMFSSLLEEDPSYTEAWHQRAVCEMLLGKYNESLTSSHRVLELDPSHTGAFVGMGLYYAEREDYEKAIDCFRRSLAIHPWLPVASKLSACLDLLSSMHKEAWSSAQKSKEQ